VFLVDDSAAFLRAITDHLQQHEDLLVVGVTCSGREALAKALDLRPDVILLDPNLPDLSGLEVIAQLRAILPDVGIIAVTLHRQQADWQAGLQVGADDYVSKHEVLTGLVPAIRRVAQVY
jgi:DNA-binding NarL/FixJ family response regulator